MGSFKVVWKRSAEKELRKLPQETIFRVVALVDGLKENPVPQGSRRLVGSERTYRLRMGEYRIVYTVEHRSSEIEINRVGHRKDIYR